MGNICNGLINSWHTAKEISSEPEEMLIGTSSNWKNKEKKYFQGLWEKYRDTIYL